MRASSRRAPGAHGDGQRVLEQGLRLVRVGGGHGSPVGDRGQCPVLPVALGEGSEIVDPLAGKVGFAGSYRSVDALDGSHPGQDREPEPAEVMKGAEGVSCAAA